MLGQFLSSSIFVLLERPTQNQTPSTEPLGVLIGFLITISKHRCNIFGLNMAIKNKKNKSLELSVLLCSEVESCDEIRFVVEFSIFPAWLHSFKEVTTYICLHPYMSNFNTIEFIFLQFRLVFTSFSYPYVIFGPQNVFPLAFLELLTVDQTFSVEPNFFLR